MVFAKHVIALIVVPWEGDLPILARINFFVAKTFGSGSIFAKYILWCNFMILKCFT